MIKNLINSHYKIINSFCCMPNTYSQIYLHFVFAVKGRLNLIAEHNREELQKYITGIVTNRGQKMLSIYCMPDHTHALIGMKPSMLISDLVKDMKTGSSNFFNKNKWIRGNFNWQEGYGVFSHSKGNIDTVAKYITNQKEHHKKTTFRTEYLGLLKEHEIEYEEKYLFEWYD